MDYIIILDAAFSSPLPRFLQNNYWKESLEAPFSNFKDRLVKFVYRLKAAVRLKPVLMKNLKASIL